MFTFKHKYNKIFSIKLAKKIIILIITAFLFDFFFFSIPALASENFDLSNEKIFESNDGNEHLLYFKSGDQSSGQTKDLLLEEITEKPSTFINHLPKSANKPITKPVPLGVAKKKISQKTGQVLMTAYNSEKAQTDNSPCTTATGFNVCKHGKEDTIAANFLPFGAKVKIPELFGDRIFVVRDRMNKRYTNKIDIWMTSKTKALQFGVKYAKIEIVP